MQKALLFCVVLLAGCSSTTNKDTDATPRTFKLERSYYTSDAAYERAKAEIEARQL